MDLYERLDTGWTMIGGQLVHLHCAERNQTPQRPTDDIDAVIDVRAHPRMLQQFTQALVDIGFQSAGPTADDLQPRWVRGAAQLDVLLAEGGGERAKARRGVTGSPTLETPGGTQALHRSKTVAILVDGREGVVPRPNLVGALVMKAAAHTAHGDPARRRHRLDFATLASLVTARDFADEELTRKDRQRLGRMVAAVRADEALTAQTSDAVTWVDRLVLAAKLH
jgi:hypothetical protein